MARTPKVPDKIQKALEEAGAKGLNRKEFSENVGASNYYYTTLLNLVHMDKACKIGDRWYWGNPERWLAEVDVDSWIHFDGPILRVLRNPRLEIYPDTRANIDEQELSDKAELGLMYYILWCQYHKKPWPTTTQAPDTSEETEYAKGRIKWLIQTVSRSASEEEDIREPFYYWDHEVAERLTHSFDEPETFLMGGTVYSCIGFINKEGVKIPVLKS